MTRHCRFAPVTSTSFTVDAPPTLGQALVSRAAGRHGDDATRAAGAAVRRHQLSVHLTRSVETGRMQQGTNGEAADVAGIADDHPGADGADTDDVDDRGLRRGDSVGEPLV